MSVVTTDIMLEGIRRDVVFDWLSQPANHTLIMKGAFSQMEEKGPGNFDLTLAIFPKQRVLEYRYKAPDDSHGGRRVLVDTGGKRTRGTLSYSLRTLKPSTNTLVTIHMDYDSGSVLGELFDRAGLQKGLEEGFKKVLENLARELRK
jgi:hypothetical protein